MSAAPDRQRIDKWLWFARVVKTRSLAQDLAESGHVRLNGRKVDAASQTVRVGDVLTIGLNGRVRVLKVAGFAERRGGSPQALETYEDLAPQRPAAATADEDTAGPEEADEAAGADERSPAQAAPQVVRGEGRPTKRDRRRFDRAGGEG